MPEGTSQGRVVRIEDRPTLAFDAYGVRIAVSTNDAALLEQVERVLPPGAKRCDEETSEHRFTLTANEDGTYDLDVREKDAVTWDASLELTMTLLESQLQEMVALHAPELIFVHAGTVAHHGRCLLVPGSSFAGKSTMVDALVRAGATYYSDDLAPLDADGRVHPYPKPLSIRDAQGRATKHDAATLGARVGGEPLPVGAIAIAPYSPGAEWRPARLSGGEAVLALLSHTVPAQERPAESLTAIRNAIQDANVLEGERDEADELAPLLLAELER